MLCRALVASLLAAVLAGCSAGSALFGPSTGAVTGHVQTRACGGANRPEQSGCPSRPDAGVTLTFQLTGTSGKGSEKTATTDANGSYRIDLEPGTYTVTASRSSASSTLARPQSFADAGIIGGFGGPHQVVVTAGKTVKADFVYTIQLL
jgi:carboxypeptidase family protein